MTQDDVRTLLARTERLLDALETGQEQAWPDDLRKIQACLTELCGRLRDNRDPATPLATSLRNRLNDLPWQVTTGWNGWGSGRTLAHMALHNIEEAIDSLEAQKG